ncbi:autotransporter outer membrane beta-barrel domain-containing protein [Snodgrassella sp. B3800]|uniref:autotransporter outer membrane beta-barrel domain-containing protein n=1 Tax=Snodgrassella sp. B3800 TaxID=2818039 RepID=UPI00226A680D|nr:autotransporter outer membrane beta-barrel domain-containing protein [Snodgrassella sp. B3800]MCX8747719.1 autotransporter outer membrane beta-barrel domain-containing protein [Snodgrassella sp. B3800]
MKSIHPPSKLKALMLGVLSSLSVYSMAATTCSNSTGCIIGTSSELGSDVYVSAGKYQNLIPSIKKYKDHWKDHQDSENLIISDPIFEISHDFKIKNPPPISVEFAPGTEITLDASFLENPAYGEHRKDYILSGINATGAWGEKLKITIPKGVHFTLQGGFKEENEEGYTISAINLDNSKMDSQADFTVNSPNSVVYKVEGSVLNAHDHLIDFGKDSSFSTAVEVSSPDGVANLDNVKINGDGEWNYGITAYSEGVANLRNSVINLRQPNSVGFSINRGGVINVNDSLINSGKGIALFSIDDLDEDDPALQNTFNIDNSELIAKDTLLSVNDSSIGDAEWADASSAARQPFVLNANNSRLEGRTYVGLHPAPRVTFNLNNGTSWLINGNSVLDELNIHDSTVSFSNDGKFKTLKINGDLTGNNSQFNMNTSLADGKSDKIEIHGQVHGQHRISVSDSRKRPKTPNGQVTLVESEGGDGSFSMVQPYVDAGKYRYFFHQNGNNWILSNDNGAASSGGSHYGPQYEISDFANSLISMRQAANQYIYQMQEPLNTRFMRRKDQSVANNLWLDSNYANNHFESVGTNDGLATSGFKQKSYSLQLGYDHLLPLGNENNQIYLGGLVGQGHSSVDFYGNYKNGNLKALTAGIYAGWNHASGWFADAAYRYSHLKASASKMDNTTWHSNSFSADVGKDFSLADKWVVTPKAGMTFGRLSGDAYNSSTTFYRSQLGAAVRTSVALNKITLHPYAGAYWLHDKNSLGHAFVDDSNMRIAGAGNSGLYEAGLGMDFNASNHADLKLDYANGQHTEQKFGINLNYRYSW